MSLGAHHGWCCWLTACLPAFDGDDDDDNIVIVFIVAVVVIGGFVKESETRKRPVTASKNFSSRSLCVQGGRQQNNSATVRYFIVAVLFSFWTLNKNYKNSPTKENKLTEKFSNFRSFRSFSVIYFVKLSGK